MFIKVEEGRHVNADKITEVFVFEKSGQYIVEVKLDDAVRNSRLFNGTKEDCDEAVQKVVNAKSNTLVVDLAKLKADQDAAKAAAEAQAQAEAEAAQAAIEAAAAEATADEEAAE